MTPADVIQWAKAAAIIGGVLVGIYAVFSPAYVWHVHHKFGWGAGVLSGFGTVLIVASLFQSVSFKMGDSVELRLAEIKKDLEETKALATASNREISRATAALNRQPAKADFAQLQKEIEKLGAQVYQIGETSNAALTGLKNIDAKIQTLPAVQNEQRGSSPNPGIYKQDGQPQFGPTPLR